MDVVEFENDIKICVGNDNLNEENTDLDSTLPYDFDELLTETNDRSNQYHIEKEISDEEERDILAILRQRNPIKWKSTSETRIKQILKKSLSNLLKDDLLDVLVYYSLHIPELSEKKSSKVTKEDIINVISQFLGTDPNMPNRVIRRNSQSH